MPPDAAAAGRTAASIHDIGYRHYEGPRLGRRYARRSLFTQSLRGAYGLGRSARSKVLPGLLFGVICLVALIIVAVAIAGPGMTDLPLEYTRYAIYLQAVIALFIAAQAPQSVSLDLRFKTVPLYFSRPIERTDYVAAKYAALTTALFILTAVPLLILYAGALLAEFDFTEHTKGFAQGIVSVALLSLLFAAIGLAVAALTPRRGFGVAAVIVVMTVPYGAVSALRGVAWDEGNHDAIGWFGIFSPITLIDNVQSAYLGATAAFDGIEPTGLAAFVSLLAVFAVTAGCLMLLLRRYRKAGL